MATTCDELAVPSVQVNGSMLALQVKNLVQAFETGCRPVDVGDILSDKYQVLGKLGYGSTSTVWLARDMA